MNNDDAQERERERERERKESLLQISALVKNDQSESN